MVVYRPERLAVARRNRGFTRAFVSARIDRSISVITKYERGECYPSVDVLARLAQVYDCPVDYFFCGVVGYDQAA